MTPSRVSLHLLPILAMALLSPGCSTSQGTSTHEAAIPSKKSSSTIPTPVFRSQNLPFVYDRGESGLALPPETTGGGVGMLDFDGDGDLDLFFAQGVSLKSQATGPQPSDCLLRNDGDGRFTDVSAQVGLISKGYGQGVAVADYDGDGDPDVYVTRYGPNTLWRNDNGHFTDVTAEASVSCGLWSLGAAFFDFDNDGDLDLFVANYFEFDRSKAPFERDELGQPRYATPKLWGGQPDVLYRNDGHGHFTDVTKQAGVAGSARGMGVLTADFDRDGWMDILVANDLEPNNLWRNRGDGTFEDVASTWGLAVNGEGRPEANMGIARGDVDGDGGQDVFITHYFNEHDTLWCSLSNVPGNLTFDDRTNFAGLGTDSLPMTGWGTALADFDQDGLLDIVVTTGHIRREPEQTYEWMCPPLFWSGRPGGLFRNASSSVGPYFRELHMGRGLACGDLDNDGDLDLVIVHYSSPSVILWNETPRDGGGIQLELIGSRGNRDAVGARVLAKVGDRTYLRSIDGGGSYISSGDRRVHIGIGSAKSIDRVEIRWPSGRVESKENIPVGSRVRWQEAR